MVYEGEDYRLKDGILSQGSGVNEVWMLNYRINLGFPISYADGYSLIYKGVL